MVDIPNHMAAEMAGNSQYDMIHILNLCFVRREESARKVRDGLSCRYSVLFKFPRPTLIRYIDQYSSAPRRSARSYYGAGKLDHQAVYWLGSLSRPQTLIPKSSG